MTDKVTKKRRGFIFVTYESEDSVDKCTEQTFHTVQETQVSSKSDCWSFEYILFATLHDLLSQKALVVSKSGFL